MPALTRRRDPDANQETWLIHYDDIRVGNIAMRTGVPIDKDQWGWSVGFYPASDRGLRASGTAKTFDAARAIFDMAWQWLLPKFTEADFTAYRRHRAFERNNRNGSVIIERQVGLYRVDKQEPSGVGARQQHPKPFEHSPDHLHHFTLSAPFAGAAAKC